MLRLSLAIASLAALTAVSALAQEGATQPASPEATSPASPEATAEVSNEFCPVMTSNRVNPNISVEYQGHRVYFCCNGCPEQFLANPDRYVSTLPQFQHPATN